MWAASAARAARAAGVAGLVTLHASQQRRQPVHCLTSPLTSSRQHLSWTGQRSVRSTALAGDRDLVRIATLINHLVDLDGWDEDQEQELFELSVSTCLEVVCQGLAPPHYDLLHTTKGMYGEKSVQLLTSNLVQLCQRECTFPYMDEQDKMRTIRAVVWVIVGSLQPGRTLRSYTKELCKEEDSCQAVVVEVFIEGAMDVFFDSEMRRSLIQDLKSHIPDMPLVPFLFENVAEFLMKTFSNTLHETLKDAYFIFVDARKNREDLPVLPTALSGDLQMQEALLMQYCGRPFMVQLRRLLVDRLLADNTKSLPVLSKMSLRTQAIVLGRFIDLLFRALPGLAKIEDTVQPFHRHLHDSSRGVQLPTPAHPVLMPIVAEEVTPSRYTQLGQAIERWHDALVRTQRPTSASRQLPKTTPVRELGRSDGYGLDQIEGSLGLGERSLGFGERSLGIGPSPAAYFRQYETEVEQFRRDGSPIGSCGDDPFLNPVVQAGSPNNLGQSPAKNSEVDPRL